MEIRCTKCQHVGEAARVIPQAAGVALECANCGHHNTLEVPGAGATTSAPDPAPSVAPSESFELGPRELARALDTSHEVTKSAQVLSPKAMARLIPEPGPGLRCLKCAHLFQESVQNCPRCGLNVDDAHRYGEGKAPWERAPEGQERAFEQAKLLWEAALKDWREETVQKYLDAVRVSDMQDMAMRNLRFYLVDHEQDELALTSLRTVAGQLQAKAFVARTQAEVSAATFGSSVKSFKRMLVAGIAVFWVVIMAIFITAFMNSR